MTMKFETIAESIPILKELERVCELIRMDHENKLINAWYQIIKPIIVENVGSNSPYPEFKNSKSYDAVYEHLSKKLNPD